MWKALIKALKSHGYDGADDDIDAIKSYIDEHFGGEVELEGKSFDVDGEYAKAYPRKSKLDLTSTAKDVEVEELKERLETAEETLELLGKRKPSTFGKAGGEQTVKVVREGWEDKTNTCGPWHDEPIPAAAFLRDVMNAGGNKNGPHRVEKGSRLEKWQMHEKASLSTYANENVGADGGFLVIPEISANINRQVESEQALLPRCNVIRTGSNTYTEPQDTVTPWDTSNGIQAYWEGEAGTYTQSKPVFRKRTWTLSKVTCLVPVTDEAAQDAIGLVSYINAKAPEKIQWKVDEAIVRGTGAGMPIGILNSSAIITVAKESNQPADTIKATNVQKMVMRMYSPDLANSMWLANQDTQVQLQQMVVIGKTDAGTSVAVGGLVYIPPGTGLSTSPFGSLLGRDIMYTQHCETVGDVGDLILANFRKYTAVVKTDGITSAISTHLWFDQDTTAYKFSFRMDGAPTFDNTISPRDGSNTMASFVVLAAR